MNPEYTHPHLITLPELILASERPAEWLIEGLYPTQEAILFTGPSHSGKTYLLIDQGMAVAYGRPWLGRFNVPKPRPVLYAPSEGRRGIGKRVRAAIEHHYPHEPLAPFVTYGGRLNLTRPASVRDLYDAIQEMKAALVIIDVLRDATPGVSENSDEMGDYFGVLRDLAHETGATFLVAHHTGKDESKGSRGHSSLKDKADQELIVKSATTLAADGSILRTNVTLTNSKNRNEENWGKLGIEIAKPAGSLAPVVIGPDSPARYQLSEVSVEASTLLRAIAKRSAEVSGGVGQVSVTYAEMADATGKARNTISDTIKPLETKGFVTIDRDTIPHRITLTDKGVSAGVGQVSVVEGQTQEVSAVAAPYGCEAPTHGQLTTVQELISEASKGAEVIDISDLLNGPVKAFR